MLQDMPLYIVTSQQSSNPAISPQPPQPRHTTTRLRTTRAKMSCKSSGCLVVTYRVGYQNAMASFLSGRKHRNGGGCHCRPAPAATRPRAVGAGSGRHPCSHPLRLLIAVGAYQPSEQPDSIPGSNLIITTEVPTRSYDLWDPYVDNMKSLAARLIVRVPLEHELYVAYVKM